MHVHHPAYGFKYGASRPEQSDNADNTQRPLNLITFSIFCLITSTEPGRYLSVKSKIFAGRLRRAGKVPTTLSRQAAAGKLKE